MPKINITEETRNKAIRLYRNKALTLREISNLVGVCEKYLQLIYREEFVKGTLKPRREAFALKPRVPNGQGTTKDVPTGAGSGGHNRKLSKEREQELAHEYYNSTCTATEFMAKWGLHPVQLQRIRQKYCSVYAPKMKGLKQMVKVAQFSLLGECLKIYDSISQASKATSVPNSSISMCCKGKSKTAGGFVWKYNKGDGGNVLGD